MEQGLGRSSLSKYIMKISLIIPAYNEEKYIEECLLSVQKNGDQLFEVIVINNASTDRTAIIVKKFPNVRLINEEKRGLPFARNRGIAEAKGDILAFIDADTKLPPNWVKQIISTLEDKNTISLSGPYIYFDFSFIKKFFVWMYWLILAWPTYLITGYMSVLGNFVVRKSAIKKIGGFNNEILFYGDDTDIAKRLSHLGKVKFSLSFIMYTSARRLKGEGIMSTAYKYVVNFLWIVFINKPKTTEHANIR